jgi:hypothetical protein
MGAYELPNHRAKPEHEGECDNKHPRAHYHKVVLARSCFVMRRLVMNPPYGTLFHTNLVCGISSILVNPQFFLWGFSFTCLHFFRARIIIINKGFHARCYFSKKYH